MALPQTIDLSPSINESQTFEQATQNTDAEVRNNFVNPTIRNGKFIGNLNLDDVDITNITILGQGSFNSLVMPYSSQWHVDNEGKMWQGLYATYALANADLKTNCFGLAGINFFPGTQTVGSVVPTTDNTKVCGSSVAGLSWSSVSSYQYITKCNVFDKLDTLSILKNIKSKGKTDKLDHSTLPELLRVGDDGMDLGKYVDLIASAIKQLLNKIDNLEDKIKKLEK